jgi:predicted dehydrogenase
MNQSRRTFMRQLGFGAAMLSFPSFQAQPAGRSAMPENKLRIAFIGLGYYSEFKLAPATRETTNCVVAGVVTGTPEKAVKWKKEYGFPDKNIYTYQNFDGIINNPDIDAVYVVLPNSMHHEFVIRAAKAGKHVICEKPMAVSVKECQEMIDACKKANVKLFVGYRLHFEPFNREAARVGQKEEFGKVKIVESSMGFKIGDPTQWRLKKSMAGGGAMMDVGIYAIQATRYCTGREPISVTAQETKTDPVKFKEVDETIFWQMEFPDGIVSSSATTYAGPMERLYISAEAGWLELKPAFGYGPLAGSTHKGVLDLPKINHQASQLQAMASAILDGKTIDATGEEGLKDMKVIEAIYRAVRSGKKELI